MIRGDAWVDPLLVSLLRTWLIELNGWDEAIIGFSGPLRTYDKSPQGTDATRVPRISSAPFRTRVHARFSSL